MSMVRYMMLAAVLFALPSQAAPIDMDRVRAAAEHWIDGSAVFRQAAIENAGPYVCDVVTPLRTSDENKVMAYHVSLKPVGYVVVSADARMFPVLCFSTASDLDLSDSQGNALRRLLFDDLDANERVLTQWDEAASLQSAMEPALAIEHRRAWEALLAGRQFLYDPTNILVDVLLETRWSQWNHYNELCPVDPAPAPSYDGRVPVGCVAAAGSQLMKYYEWPPHGWGGHSYTDSEPTVTGAHSAVFSDPYDWDNMLTSYDAYGYVPLTQELAVSELIYEVGVSVEMDYGSYYNDNGSGASSDDLGSALSTYFFYEQHAYMNRSNNPAAFDQMMRDSISAGDPVVVSIPGHAILADGLSSDAQTNFFHINYGWGGINDGWYMPSDINSKSLYRGIFGPKPAFLPILSAFGEATNTSGILTNEWVFPPCRLAELDHYQLAQGVFTPTNMLDTGQSYDAWVKLGAPWTNLASGGYPGACYFKQNAYASSPGAMMSGPFIPAADTVLRFDYKAQLNTDHFYVEVSDDDGMTWDVLLHETDYSQGWSNGWWEGSFSLGGYAGQVCQIRFRYATGGYWIGTYGVYVDNISCSHVEMLTWTVIDSNISSAASSYVVSNLADGVYYYSLAAADGSGLQEAGPLVSVTVLKPDDDMDDDGIPDDWEELYFGSATGATAGVDTDGDAFTNWEEWRAGTNPTNPLSFFAFESVGPAAGLINITWPSISNRTYALYRGTNLTGSGVTCLQSNMAPTPPSNTYTDTNVPGSTFLFYRVATE